MTVQTLDAGVLAGPDPTGGRLVAWATAADAAHQLATRLVWTSIVPDGFRAQPRMTPAEQSLTVGNATAAILMGDEVGLSPLAALRSIYVIKGQPAMYARAMVALAQSRGHRIWTELETADTVVVCGHRAGDPDHVERVTWTLIRAKSEGLFRNPQWTQRPQAMLWARASTDVARRIAADVLLGIPELTADELTGDVEADRPAPSPPVVRKTRVRTPTPPAPSPPGPGAYDDPDVLRAVREVTQGGGGEPEPREPDPPEPDATDDPPPAPDEPTPDDQGAPVGTMTGAQRGQMFSLFNALGIKDRGHRLGYTVEVIGRDIETSTDLTVQEASAVIERLAADAREVES
jgi:hypothetical protein